MQLHHVTFDDATRGYYRRNKAQRATSESSLIAAIDRAGARLFKDRAGTPESVRAYIHAKRCKLLWLGDCNCLSRHMF